MSVLWTLLRRAETKKNSEALHLKLFLQSKLLRSMKGLEGPAEECIKEALRRSSEVFLDPYSDVVSSPARRPEPEEQKVSYLVFEYYPNRDLFENIES